MGNDRYLVVLDFAVQARCRGLQPCGELLATFLGGLQQSAVRVYVKEEDGPGEEEEGPQEGTDDGGQEEEGGGREMGTQGRERVGGGSRGGEHFLKVVGSLRRLEGGVLFLRIGDVRRVAKACMKRKGGVKTVRAVLIQI